LLAFDQQTASPKGDQMQKLIFTIAFASLLAAGAARAGGFGANPSPPPNTNPPPAVSPPPQLPLGGTDAPITPEPLTMGALALGAAGIVTAKLRRRKTA
jgi:PEP-CTERM motif